MWVGQQLADGLDFWGFLGSLILGRIILGIYTGLLGYVGAKTGLSLDLLSQRAFGEKGSYLPSAMTALRRSDGLVSAPSFPAEPQLRTSHVLQRTENLVPSPRLWLSLSEIP